MPKHVHADLCRQAHHDAVLDHGRRCRRELRPGHLLGRRHHDERVHDADAHVRRGLLLLGAGDHHGGPHLHAMRIGQVLGDEHDLFVRHYTVHGVPEHVHGNLCRQAHLDAVLDHSRRRHRGLRRWHLLGRWLHDERVHDADAHVRRGLFLLGAGDLHGGPHLHGV